MCLQVAGLYFKCETNRCFAERRKYMGEKDITEKLLEDYPDVFADIFNVLVFDGKKECA